MIVKCITVYLALINIGTFLLYGIDKRKAINEKWRISERMLLLVSLSGGSLGALTGMNVFHHKTRNLRFRILIPVFLLIHLALVGIYLMQS